jgi:hypothetical protein
MKALVLSIAAIAVPIFVHEVMKQVAAWREQREIERRREKREAK